MRPCVGPARRAGKPRAAYSGPVSGRVWSQRDQSQRQERRPGWNRKRRLKGAAGGLLRNAIGALPGGVLRGLHLLPALAAQDPHEAAHCVLLPARRFHDRFERYSFGAAISGDTIADWSHAFELVPCLQVAYVWHASRFTSDVLRGLLRIGFLHHQQIIWNKGRTVLTRTHYWFQHEPCWYVRKKNAPWFGTAGENSTVWDSASPKFIMGRSDEEKYDHPTQKPVELMRRPILNHTHRGDVVYDGFLCSGTTLAAAELTERVCYGIELDPKYVDVVVQRWQGLSGKKATLDGDGRTFDEIAQERAGQATPQIESPPDEKRRQEQSRRRARVNNRASVT